MWKCIKCHEQVPSSRVDPGIDDFGIYFICPFCGRRNKIESLGEKGGALLLRQTGD